MKTRGFLGVLLCCSAPMIYAQDGTQPSPETLARFLQATRNPTEVSIETLQAELAAAKSMLRDMAAGRIVPEVKETLTTANRFGRVEYQFPTAQERQRLLAETQRQIDDLQVQITSIRSGRGIVPRLQLNNLHVGAMGTLPDHYVQVVKIIDSRNWIGKLRRPILGAERASNEGHARPESGPSTDRAPTSTPYVWIANVPTDELRTKSSVDCRQTFYVSGQQKYLPTPGRPQLIFVLTATMTDLPATGDKLYGDTLPPTGK